MIEQTNEIVRRFNRLYKTKALRECQPVLSKTGRLIGIDGKTKASKSLNNCIFLEDSKETIKSKIQSMYTDPKHLRVEDPGSTKGNAVFAYLDAFFEHKEELERLKRRYRKGGLGDGVVKALLNDTLQKLLEPIREKREALLDKDVLECLLEGSRKANQTAAETLLAVKEAMHLDYAM